MRPSPLAFLLNSAASRETSFCLRSSGSSVERVRYRRRCALAAFPLCRHAARTLTPAAASATGAAGQGAHSRAGGGRKAARARLRGQHEQGQVPQVVQAVVGHLVVLRLAHHLGLRWRGRQAAAGRGWGLVGAPPRACRCRAAAHVMARPACLHADAVQQVGLVPGVGHRLARLQAVHVHAAGAAIDEGQLRVGTGQGRGHSVGLRWRQSRLGCGCWELMPGQACHDGSPG